MNRLLPRLAPADAAEHFPGPRAITTTPSVAECESLCQPIGGDMAIGKERLGEINRHLRVVGPPQAAVASLSDEPPDASFQRAAFVGSAHRIASGEPKDAADEAICFHVDTAESRPLPNVTVHRAAVDDIEFRTRAARGSVCNGLFCPLSV